MHTGEVIAGITGTNIIRYDIYGPDTVIGEAMESNGEIWKIQVSDVTKQILESRVPGRFRFEYHKNIIEKKIDSNNEAYYLYEAEDED